MKRQQPMLHLAEDAADWLLRLETDDSAQCRQSFIAWLKDSPRHVDEFLLISAAARAARQGARALHFDAAELKAEAPMNVIALPRNDIDSSANLQRNRRPMLRMAVAAAAATLGLVAVLVHFTSGVYSTSIGEQRSVKLADGSMIYLNTRSKVKVQFSGARRDIKLLEGEALFVAAPDTARPFRVLSGSSVIQALGTQFNIYAREKSATVSVVEGRISIAGGDENDAAAPPILKAGDQARIADDGHVVQEQGANLTRALAWRERRLVFQNDTLEDIVREFNRYNRNQIRLAGAAPAKRRFTAVFNADEPQALLNFLHADPALEIATVRGGKVIKAR